MRSLKHWLFLLGVFWIPILSAQVTNRIQGVVTDAVTGEVLPYANVAVLPGDLFLGTITGKNGSYLLEYTAQAESIVFSFVGYESQTVKIASIQTGKLNIQLKPLSTEIEEAVVSARRIRYKRRGNPAVELMRKVVANKDNNRMESRDHYAYERYEKVQLSLNELNDSIKNGMLFRKFPFLTSYLDTSKTGLLSLPVFLRENISEHYFRKSPRSSKEILKGSRMADFNELIEKESIGVFLDGLVGKSNIYDSKIMILENEYISPVSSLAITFYHFHILDTVAIGGTSCINLSVYPSNPQDFGFRGNLYITNDSMYALKRAELAFTKNATVNFVNDFSLIQEYTLIDSTWCLTLDEAVIDFGLTKNRSLVLGKRSNTYTNYRFDSHIPETVLSGINNIEKAIGYDILDDGYWKENRPIALSRSEQGVYDMVADMKKDRLFKHALNLTGIIYSGYISVGPVDLGPIETFLSFNDVEGARVRLGGKTNTNFNRHLFLEGFAAYGFKDQRFKYRLGAMYSFNERKIHPWEYPMDLLHISYEDNIMTPGQFFMFGSGDRLLLSFYRGNAQKMVYHRTFNIKYDKEYASGFSFQPSFTRREEKPAGDLAFTNESGTVKSVITSQLGLKLRFAPNERFYQVQQNRYSLNHTNPVFTVNYSYGMKGVWDGDYEFHRLELGIDKRSWFSSFGFADTWIKAGKIWGTVPFPLLVIHQANQNYSYQDRAFNMMNYMEFVSDTYAQINFSYCFNGWIFNRIPLIKKLKWREFISFNALWGNLSDRNHPDHHPELLHFSVNESGIPTMYSLENKPYMEAGIAIDNIFKIIRIDLIKRLNYLNHPDIPEWGIRFRLRFLF